MTARRRLRALSPMLQDQLESVLDQLGDGVTVQGPDGDLVYANDSAARLAGFQSADDLLATPVEDVVARFELLDESGLPLPVDELPGRLALHGERPVERLLRFRDRSSGTERWAMVQALPVQDKEHGELYAVNLFRDVTALRQAERQRQRSLEREQAARAEAERAAETFRKLERVTQVALAHLTMGDLLDAMLEQLMTVLGGDTSAILLLDENGRHLTVRAAKGFEHELEHAVPVPIGKGMAGRVAASGEPLLIHDLAEIELASPHLRERGIASLVAIPIAIEGRVIGVAHVGSVDQSHFGEEDVRLLGLLADRVALAITQALFYERERQTRNEAEEARQRLAFLATASTVLSSSLDYESTLQAVTRIVVPRLADWCDLHLVDAEDRLALLATAHVEPSRVADLERLAAVRARSSDDPAGPYAVLRTGASELASEVSDGLRVRFAGSLEGAEALAEIGFVSYMCVPMTGHDRALGTITFVSGDPDRRFGETDLELAEELARRVALTVENALLYRQAEERAQAARVLASIGDGVLLVDARGVVRLWNRAATAITGLAESDVVGGLADEAIPGWRELGPRVPVVADLSGAVARAEVIPVETAAGERWLSISGVGFSDGTVYAFRDLTQDRLLDELKADFVATVSHELRTPLAAIYGAAMTLQRPDFEADAVRRAHLLSVISSESEQLASIVDDIVWAGRLDADTIQLSIQSCDSRELAGSVLASAEVHCPAKVDLELVVRGELAPVSGDPDKIRQVLVNLVDNAVKYSPDGGSVTVELSAGETSLRVAVHDEGLGVPPAEQRRIFDKFYRLDPNLTRGVGGTGLGLYICRELVRRMNGRIWVASPRHEGRGSTFAFELPLAEAGRQEEPPRA